MKVAGPDVAAARERVAPHTESSAQPPGCHTVTLLVTHKFRQEFGGYYCAADPADVDTLTWWVSVCDRAAPDECSLDDCPVHDANPGTYCDDMQ